MRLERISEINQGPRWCVGVFLVTQSRDNQIIVNRFAVRAWRLCKYLSQWNGISMTTTATQTKLSLRSHFRFNILVSHNENSRRNFSLSKLMDSLATSTHRASSFKFSSALMNLHSEVADWASQMQIQTCGSPSCINAKLICFYNWVLNYSNKEM